MKLPARPRAFHWLRSPAAALIVADLVPVYGVLALRWQVGSVMAFFWSENLVIGLFNILKMAVAGGASRSHAPSLGERIGRMLFFAAHYGLFTFGHGVFLAGLFRLDWRRMGGEIAVALAVLLAGHGYAFARQFIGQGAYRRATIEQLFLQPYRRVLIMHVTLILGGLLAKALGSPLGFLLALAALKTAFDLRAHARESRSPKEAHHG